MQEPPSYTLNLTTILTDLSNLQLNHSDIKIICYHVNNSGKFPFIQIMLHNYSVVLPFIEETNQNFQIPTINTKNPQEICEKISMYLQTMGINIEDNSISKINIKGYLEINNNYFVFVDVSQLAIDGLFLRKNNEYWFALLTEIINNQNICDIQMDIDTIHFFTDYHHLFLLENSHENTNFPLPNVAFSGCHFKLSEFRSVFALEKQKTKFGEHYCFTYSLKNAFKNGAWSKTNAHEYKYDKLITDNEYGRYIEGGINRYAILMDKMDFIDESELLIQENPEEFIEGKLLDYDSIQISCKDTFIIIANYNQQISLSYHKINKYFLYDKYQENNKYDIE
jgi:hypothetical protein